MLLVRNGFRVREVITSVEFEKIYEVLYIFYINI